jgi:hypothetical protein
MGSSCQHLFQYLYQQRLLPFHVATAVWKWAFLRRGFGVRFKRVSLTAYVGSNHGPTSGISIHFPLPLVCGVAVAVAEGAGGGVALRDRGGAGVWVTRIGWTQARLSMTSAVTKIIIFSFIFPLP